MKASISHFHGKFSFQKLPSQKNVYSSSCCKPMLVVMAQDQRYWASAQLEIEEHLKKVIQVRDPVSVFEPMHHTIFAPPRIAAPALCIAACELVGGDRDQAMAAASAIHLMHVAMYTHEHLLVGSIDKPKPKMRPRPKFGPNVELMTGDGIIPFGFELVTKSIDPGRRSSDAILRVVVEITRAIGSQGMVYGKFQELFVNRSNDMEGIEYVCERKEGGLHACGAACGAILGGGSEEEIERLRKYGVYFGTMQGMLYGAGRNNIGLKKKVETLRMLAIKELENFTSKKVETFYNLLELEFEPMPCNI